MEDEGDGVMENLATDDIIDIVKGKLEDDFEEEDDGDEEVETGATFGLFGDPSAKEEEEDLNAKYNHVSQSKDPDHSNQDESPGASSYHQESFPPLQTGNPYHQVE